ncbi:MAG: hypothetical protein CFE32_23230, partial [Alphaproteobacteria bacterium PA3]
MIFVPNGIGMRLSLPELCATMLPKLALQPQNTIYAHIDFDPRTRVWDFLGSIKSKSCQHTVVWPVLALATDELVQLEDITVFRELTEVEKLHCLNHGMIQFRGQGFLAPQQSRFYGLCVTLTEEKKDAANAVDHFELNKR